MRSWTGTSSAFQNILGTSLQDASANVQKIMYNWSATTDTFYWRKDYNQFMNMSDTTIDDAFDKMTPITQLRPAIQIRTLIKLIIAKAGFTYTSDFIDCTGDYASENYFGKLFMTLANKIGEPFLPSSTTGVVAPAGGFLAYSDTSNGWGSYTNIYSCINPARSLFQAGTEPINQDPQSAWNGSKHYFTKVSGAMSSISIFFRIKRRYIRTCVDDSPFIPINVSVQEWDTTEDELTGSSIPRGSFLSTNNQWSEGTAYAYQYIEYQIDVTDLAIGKSYRIYLQPSSIKRAISGGGYQAGSLQLAEATWSSSISPASVIGNSFTSYIQSGWASYTLDQYGGEIDIPACMDDTITQKAFLQDIIQRFNLVILSDPNDPSNLIIEPYTHFVSSGVTKDWTDKLDLSKERVLKDTVMLQKKEINFSDLEDVDFENKTIKEVLQRANVYGKFNKKVSSSDFATGELKNSPIFSPYINCMLRMQPNLDFASEFNIPTHHEYSYTQTDSGFEPTLQPTQPKLFYYNGTPSPTTTEAGEPLAITNYYLHQVNTGNGTITAHAFNKYPVCTPYDIQPDADGYYILTEANKSLYWNFAPPRPTVSMVTNWYGNSPQWEGNALYLLYWSKYLNELYSEDARIMECHLNLNEVDIYDFKFNDQLFIKDTYWRILEISNYQVGAKASTKVTLIKVLDSLSQPRGCNYVASGIGYFGNYVTWCPEDDPDCTPVQSSPFTGYYADPECCEAIGGQVDYSGSNFSSQGLFRCFPTGTSLPL